MNTPALTEIANQSANNRREILAQMRVLTPKQQRAVLEAEMEILRAVKRLTPLEFTAALGLATSSYTLSPESVARIDREELAQPSKR